MTCASNFKSFFFVRVLSIIFAMLSFFSCSEKGISNNEGGTYKNLLNIISNPKDKLIGRYTTKEGGTEAEIKISKENNNYYVSVMHTKWSKPDLLKGLTNDDFVEVFGEDWKDFVEAGLYTDGFMISKVKQGYQDKNHTFKTGYVVIFLGYGDIYKLD